MQQKETMIRLHEKEIFELKTIIEKNNHLSEW